MDPLVARKTWRTLEPIHGMVYFVAEADDAYRKAGLQGGRMGYFASRSAPMGPVAAEVVVATFYNFNPALVRRVIPRAWHLAPPDRILAARLEAVDQALQRAWSAEVMGSAELVEAASLARRAAESVTDDLAARPLFAGHASLPWPDAAHLVLWHAQTLLREYRGDGHVAALLVADLDPVETLVTHAATGEVGADVLKATRAWPDQDWAAAVDRLRSRRLIEAGEGLSFTDEGTRIRQEIEDMTDARALAAYEVLGEDGCRRLRELARPLSQAVVAAGLLAADPGRLLG
ncbi:MAG: SCO6745 family protein [Acidimicrobiales bacterium]